MEAVKLKSDRTIRRMENGEVEIGGPVQVAVELMLARIQCSTTSSV